jgi:hypothetical protein
LKKKNGGKFGKNIWRQIIKKNAGNVKHKFGGKNEKNGSRKRVSSLGVISGFFPGIEIVVPSGGIPVSLNQFTRKRLTANLIGAN